MIEVLKKAAIAWWKETLKYFWRSLELKYKSWVADFCTQADIESENKILEIIKNSKISSFNIYAEESWLKNKNSDYTLIIDPLDWTNNFKLWIPNWSVSIWVMKWEEIVAGVVYQPLLDIMYEAELWKWVLKNWEKITVNGESDISKCSLSYVQWYTPKLKYENIIYFLDNFVKNGIKRTLTNWSPANDFCFLAEWKIEWIVVLDTELYDFCAGKLIVKEAWAIIKNIGLDSDNNSRFICTNNSEEVSKFLLDTTLEALKK